MQETRFLHYLLPRGLGFLQGQQIMQETRLTLFPAESVYPWEGISSCASETDDSVMIVSIYQGEEDEGSLKVITVFIRP